jgi:general secretion pathway protein G
MATKYCLGYTLVELLVVLAMMGVLASVAMPAAQAVVQRDRERELRRALWEIRDAIDAWRRACAQGAIVMPDGALPFPPSLSALAELQPDQRAERNGHVLRFLRRVPRDPFAAPGQSAEQTWAQRSYRSEANRPEPGSEVYDVHSRYGGLGLNGVPISTW